ncbi:hypothetical protein [Mycolicibacterium poriferae]|uniref:hypothetical protein n=1 Tax=Mycolicibacterium poriferae TaxID=39694 RepID=UPI003D2F1009
MDYNHPDLVDNMWTNPGEIPGDGIDNDGNGVIDDVHGYHAADDHDAAHHHDTPDDGADHHPYPGPDDHRAADHGRRARTPDAGPHHHDEPGGAVRTGAHPDPGTCGTLTPTPVPAEP